jgi:ComF family protein
MNYIDFISKILFPPRCLACDARVATGILCELCFDKIPHYKTFFCAHCDARLPSSKKICHQNAPYILGAAGPYGDPTLKLLIHRLKFRGVRRAAKPLADLLARYLADVALNTGEFILIPLPLSKRRQNERGFNQAEEIAWHLAKRLPLTVRSDILTRNRHTKPQTETANAAERQRNILDCFSIARPDDVSRKDIIILDDVTTSGATLGDAARALKAAGARKIIGLTAAKA